MNSQFSTGLVRGAILALITAGAAFAAQLSILPNRAILAVFLTTFFTALISRLGEAGYDSSRAKVGAVQPGDVGYRELTSRRAAMLQPASQGESQQPNQPPPHREATQPISLSPPQYRPEQTNANTWVDPRGTSPGR